MLKRRVLGVAARSHDAEVLPAVELRRAGLAEGDDGRFELPHRRHNTMGQDLDPTLGRGEVRRDHHHAGERVHAVRPT